MSRSNFSLKGAYCVEDFDIDGLIYTAEGTFTGRGYEDSGRMYMPNGDPGYPPEGEEEWTDWQPDYCTVYDPETDTDKGIDYDQYPEALKKRIEEEISSKMDDGDWEVVDDYYDPPEPDDYDD